MASEEYIDQPVVPRSNDEIDLQRASVWFKANVDGADDVDEVQQFVSGGSNLTYLIRSGDKEWILRCPPSGAKAVGAQDVTREYRALDRLANAYSYSPKAIALCTDEAVLGEKFYVMERINGVILRDSLPSGFKLTERQASKMCEQVVDAQAKLHKIDIEEAGLKSLGNPRGYVERQIEGWINRFSRSRTNDVADCEDIMEWLQENMPIEDDDNDPVAILHNDYKLDNLILDADNICKLKAVLDWEALAVGHPLMDVGISLAYWVQADDPRELQEVRQVLTHLPGMMTRKQYIARYAKKTGLDVSNIDYYYVYGLFRLIGMTQQIYYRHVKGVTRNPENIDYGLMVNQLASYTDSVVSKL